MADVNLRITDRAGEVRTISAHAGDVLMQVLRDQIDLTLGTCGGAVSCGTCLVRLSPGWLGMLPAPSVDEAEMLEALSAGADCRLSCQLVLGSAADGQQATLVAAE